MKEDRIVIVDDEEVILESVRLYFDERCIVTHSDPRAALRDMEQTPADVLICDFRMPHLSGLDLLREARRRNAYRYGVLLTAFADKDLLLSAIQERLVDGVIEKPLRMDVLEKTLDEAILACRKDDARRREIAEARELYRRAVRSGASLSQEVVGLEGGLADAFAVMKSAAGTRESILFCGETGTGKEVAARLVHSMSDHAAGPFVKINCGALPESLAESELFGHVKGAFTGAEMDRQGRIELAAGGTLFLDEVGELSPATQVRLLQVLQEKIVEPLGSNRRTRVDFRLMCATNRDLEAEIAQGQFRADLFYRINTIRLTLPPLRERVGDIPVLARSIVDSFCAEINRRPPRFPDGIFERLMRYRWPGNIRELENVLKRAVILTDPSETTLSERALDCLRDGGERRSAAGGPGQSPPSDGELPVDALVEEMATAILHGRITLEGVEESLLESLLKRHDGNVRETAQRAGVSKDRLYRHRNRKPD